MKARLTIILLFSCLSLSAGTGENFATRFHEAQKRQNTSEIERLLKTAADSEKNNPDYYALAANYRWGMSQSINISTKPPVDGDYSIQDPKTGKAVGSISTVGDSNPKIKENALALVKEGFRRFPKRADICLGLACIQREMGLDDACVETLESLLNIAAQSPGELLWTENGKIPGKTAIFIPEAVNDYATYYFRKETKEDDVRCERICKSAIKFFPDHPYAFNVLGGLWSAHGDNAKSIEYFKRGLERGPEDPLILLNMGDVYLKLNKKKDAIAVFKQVFNLKTATDDNKKQAQDKLASLKE